MCRNECPAPPGSPLPPPSAARTAQLQAQLQAQADAAAPAAETSGDFELAEELRKAKVMMQHTAESVAAAGTGAEASADASANRREEASSLQKASSAIYIFLIGFVVLLATFAVSMLVIQGRTRLCISRVQALRDQLRLPSQWTKFRSTESDGNGVMGASVCSKIRDLLQGRGSGTVSHVRLDKTGAQRVAHSVEETAAAAAGSQDGGENGNESRSDRLANRTYAVGEEVTVSGLKAKHHLNGLGATILAWDAEKGMHKLRLKGGSVVLLKPANIAPLPGSSPPDSNGKQRKCGKASAAAVDQSQLLPGGPRSDGVSAGPQKDAFAGGKGVTTASSAPRDKTADPVVPELNLKKPGVEGVAAAPPAPKAVKPKLNQAAGCTATPLQGDTTAGTVAPAPKLKLKRVPPKGQAERMTKTGSIKSAQRLDEVTQMPAKITGSAPTKKRTPTGKVAALAGAFEAQSQ